MMTFEPKWVTPTDMRLGYILGIAFIAVAAVVILAIADYWLKIHGKDK